MPNNKLTPAQKRAAAKAKVTADYNKSFDANWGWINSLVGLDKTPKGGKSLAWALDKIKTQKITDPNVAANILNQTNWYKNHSQTASQNLSQEKTNPGIFNQKVDELKAELVKEAVAKGFVVSDKELRDIARTAYVYGQAINSATVINQLGEHKKSMSGGTYQASVDALKQSAYKNGVQYNDAWYETAARDVVAGSGTLEGWNKQIKDAAKSRYPVLSAQLDAGMTVMDVASPYMQQMATTFETNPNAIKLDDPTLQKALTNLNKDSQPELKPLWQFSRELKQDDRYFKTNQAHQDMEGMATEIARQFGRAS